jgi:hypothetical protein
MSADEHAASVAAAPLFIVDDAIARNSPGGDRTLQIWGAGVAFTPLHRRHVATDTRPPRPTTIPSSWFGQLPSKPIDYRPVVPDRVVELDVDTAFEHYRWRHGARRGSP